MSIASTENRTRASAALGQLRNGGHVVTNREELATAITDTITNLAHLCDRDGVNMAHLIELAHLHYNDETEGMGRAFCPLSERHPRTEDEAREMLRHAADYLYEQTAADGDWSAVDVLDHLRADRSLWSYMAEGD